MKLDSEKYSVKTRDDLVALIHCLSKESLNDKNSWENKDLSSYLEAVASWIEDMDGFYENIGKPLPDDTAWSVFADILMAARVYE